MLFKHIILILSLRMIISQITKYACISNVLLVCLDRKDDPDERGQGPRRRRVGSLRRQAAGGVVGRPVRRHQLHARHRPQLRGVAADDRQCPAAGRPRQHDGGQRDVGGPSRQRPLRGLGVYKVGRFNNREPFDSLHSRSLGQPFG